jgi:hypothetical protein
MMHKAKNKREEEEGEEEEKEEEIGVNVVKNEGKFRPGDDFNGYQARNALKSDLLTDADKHPDKPLLTSPKLRGILELLESWWKEAPDDKIISE